MPQGWQWDATLFKGSAAYYEQGRLPYAPGFAEALAGALDLDGHGRLLDVGCGPGTVTLPLSRYFAEAVGVDPDPDMLAEAARRAEQLGSRNVRWVEARAEDLPAGLGRFRLAVFAQSFHWTDRDQVAAVAFVMLEERGAFVHMSDRKEPPVASAPLPYPAPPREEIGALIRRYLGPVRRAGQGLLAQGTPDREDLVLTRAGFSGPERLVVPGGEIVERSDEDVAAWVFSRSDSAPHLFGDQLADFERDLQATLHNASPGGVFAVVLPDTEIFVWRKPRRAGRSQRPPAPVRTRTAEQRPEASYLTFGRLSLGLPGRPVSNPPPSAAGTYGRNCWAILVTWPCPTVIQNGAVPLFGK
jgi:SAM-dependent methyltransferase